ncbi:MAG: hypothetical protein METHP_01174 [Methanoregula sp. SKADARSKE-2]|nr:MAG: hypothetical protein METHP_01174 [Methanoregula sp. SKADARSKE-2]
MFNGFERTSSGMRRVCSLLIALALVLLILPPAGAAVMTISAAPDQAHLGDVITLHGRVTGVNTIAVYLFLTGPGLDPRGVTLENLNVPAGRGLFTTAPVNLSDGRWSYSWDTAIILGNLELGTYTVYEVRSPLDRLRSSQEDFAKTDISFLPAGSPVTESPSDPVLPVLAIALLGMGRASLKMRSRD